MIPNPNRYVYGHGHWYAIATRRLNPTEGRPKKPNGVWFVHRFKSVFVPARLLSQAVTGLSFGMDLDVLREDVETNIAAHRNHPYDMVVALSQRSVVNMIRSQL